jgi:hypothetical protein
MKWLRWTVVFILLASLSLAGGCGGDDATKPSEDGSSDGNGDQRGWSPMGQLLGGAGAEDLAVYGGRLFAARHGDVVAWDGTEWTWDGIRFWHQWSPAGPQSLGTVTSLEVFDGGLVAGGYFRTLTMEERGWTVLLLNEVNVARWDGLSWEWFGYLLNEDNPGAGVVDLVVHDGCLAACFSGFLDRPVRWRCEDSWSGLDGYTVTGVSPEAMATFHGELIVGGVRSVGSDSPMAAWNGTSWRAITGVDGGVDAMVEYRGELIVGGRGGTEFTTSGGSITHGIAAWDGSEWRTLGQGMDSDLIYDFVVSGEDLYVGGSFERMGGLLVNGIAKWDGSQWSALAGGISGHAYPTVKALAVYEGDLIVSGTFTKAGSVEVSSVARWRE